MTEQYYDLFFKGELLDGYFADFVKSDIQKLFRADAAYVEKLFTGKEQLIKKQVNKATAVKFQQAFKQAGARLIVRLHGQTDVAAQPAAPASPEEPAQELTTTTQEKPNASPAVPDNHIAMASDAPANNSVPPEGDTASDFVVHHQPDIHAPEKTPDWDVAEAGSLLETLSDDPAPVQVDTSALSVAEPGANLGAGSGFEEPVPVIDTSQISIADAGGTIDTLKDEKPPVKVDISHLSVE